MDRSLLLCLLACREKRRMAPPVVVWPSSTESKERVGGRYSMDRRKALPGMLRSEWCAARSTYG